MANLKKNNILKVVERAHKNVTCNYVGITFCVRP